MQFIGRLIALLGGGLMLAAALGTIAARSVKQQIVPVDAPDADEVKLAAIFEPIAFRSRATRFRGGTIDTWYGGGIIDLREATLDPAGATLHVRAVFGGGQIVVPEDWRVSSHVVGIGGLGDGRPRIERPEGAPRLTIDGVVVFGGFGVSSDIPEEGMKSLDEAIARRRNGKATEAPELETEPIA
jgi:hypothetical protein